MSPTVAELLAFERRWWKYAGSKEQAIADELGMSSTRYYQALNSALDTVEALEVDAVTTHRLQRVRARQRAPLRLAAQAPQPRL